MVRLIRLPEILVPLAAVLAAAVAHPVSAQDASAPVAWQVSKSSGDVWLTNSGVQPASLGDQATLKPGDSIRTGRNGRVLLVRGQETILIAPNSAITLPAPAKDGKTDGQSATIIEQAGSILLKVDKRDIRNFEVETPYLVAAVKGTQFGVSVDRNESHVNVLEGSVEVADIKSGQFALVLPGQSAKVTTQSGLSLSGAGTLGPIQNGTPHPNALPRLPVPHGGFTAPASVPDGQHVHALGVLGSAHADAADLGGNHGGNDGGNHSGALHISVALGDVTLDIQKVTQGLAHATAASANGQAAHATVWSSGTLTPGNGLSGSLSAGNNGSGAANAGGNGNGIGVANGNVNGNAIGHLIGVGNGGTPPGHGKH